MNNPPDSHSSNDSLLPRRDFLKRVAAVGSAAGAAVALPKIFGAAEAPAPAAAAPAIEAPFLTPRTKGTFGIKPREIPFHPIIYKDKYTGRRVTRMTPPGQVSNHFYFTSTSYDAEGRIIFVAEVDKSIQLVRADMKRGTLHCLTDLRELDSGATCLCPATNTIIIKSEKSFLRMNLDTGACEWLLLQPSPEWDFGIPTIDAAGKRIAFSMTQYPPTLPAANVQYASMPVSVYQRPHSMIVTIDLDTNLPAVVWGETEFVSHVHVNPVDPDTIVYCHEGGDLVDNRLWVVDARLLRKKHARCLYPEKYEEFLVHEYFCKDGTLGVQITEYDPSDATRYDSKSIYSGALFIKPDGKVVANYRLPGWRAGHIQSNSNNSCILADAYLPQPESNWDQSYWEEGWKFMSLNYPVGNTLRVERLCYHGTNWSKTHPHAIFSPDDKQVLFASHMDDTSNSVFLVDI